MFERFLLSFRGTEGKRVFWSMFCNTSPANGILPCLPFFENREVKIIVDKFTLRAQRAFGLAEATPRSGSANQRNPVR